VPSVLYLSAPASMHFCDRVSPRKSHFQQLRCLKLMGNRLGILLHRLTNVAHNMGYCCSFRKLMIRYEIGYSCFHSHPERSSFEV